MPKHNHNIKLLISNLPDRELLASFLRDAGYLVDCSTTLIKEKWNETSAIITDETCGRFLAKDLLYMKNSASPVFLPITVCLPSKNDGTPWIKIGFDEVIHLPLIKAEFKSRIATLLRLREETEVQFHLIYENIDIGIYRMSETMNIIQANPAFLKILGISSFDNVLGKNISDINVKFSDARKTRFQEVSMDNKLIGYESSCMRQDGYEIVIRENAVFFQSKESGKCYYTGTIEDVTHHNIVQGKLIKSEEKFRQLVHLSPYGILIELDEKIVFMNDAAIKIFKAAQQNLIGTYLLDRVHDASRQAIKNRLLFVREQQISTDIIEDQLLDINNNIIAAEVLVCPFLFDGTSSTQIIINDITNRKNAENKLFYIAYHDPLTGIANRLKLEEELNRFILFAKRNAKYVAVIFIDIDFFKKINDTFGHNIGDLLLKEVANRLNSCLPVGDLVARLGGDEFVILLGKLSDPVIDATEIINKVMSSIALPFNIQNIKVDITVSLGASFYPDNGMNGYTLFKNSDIAMYTAKQNGRNTFQFCTSELSDNVSQKAHLEMESRDALSRDELLLYYQPKISFKSGKVVGTEALLRWKHPKRGLISPIVFIPIAEASGLIVPITILIIHQACQQIKLWEKQNVSGFSVAINLSMRHFQEKNMVEDILNILNTYEISPSAIEFEITESTLMQNIDNTLKALNSFRNKGIHISIDDFGTGYSSLGYLKQLNCDSLKIDKLFVDEIRYGSSGNTIILSIIDMAHKLQMKVIAEGVETMYQFEFLKENDCDEMQGYLFSEPLPADELLAFINSHKVVAT